MQSEQINELATSLAKAQGQFVPALKDTCNPFYKSKYANLCSIVKACQEPLSVNGLSISQTTQKIDGEWVLVTKLLHCSGQWMESTTPIITLKPDIQSFGTACTYARRYAWASICGVTTDEDDDGESNMNRAQVNTPREIKKPVPSSNAVPEPIHIEYATKEQTDKLKEMIAQAGKNVSFVNDLLGYLKSCKINDFEDMPLPLYNKIFVRVDMELKKQINEVEEISND